MQKNLKYLDYTIACQEVPNEVSLIINVSGCPHHCEGCHSPELWNYDGNFIRDNLQDLINKYPNMITCVCFMGGDQNIEELNELLIIVKKQELKTCVYSGFDVTDIFDLSLLDYLKVGHFSLELGGLDKSTTNQRFYKVESNNLTDKTNTFQKSYVL